jgi:hypothetical protein
LFGGGGVSARAGGSNGSIGRAGCRRGKGYCQQKRREGGEKSMQEEELHQKIPFMVCNLPFREIFDVSPAEPRRPFQ